MMNQELGSLKCLKCNKKIRPAFKICAAQHLVCPHCKHHSLNGLEGSRPNAYCADTEIELTAVNGIFKHMSDYCQYDCGYLGPLLELQAHEKDCIAQQKSIKCLIDGCNWSDPLDKLICHFAAEHPELLIEHSNLPEPERQFDIGFCKPICLIIMFPKDYFCNEIYWMRLSDDKANRHIMIQYQGHVGKFIEPAQKLDTFKITSLENEHYFVMGDVCFSPNNPDKHIMNDESLKLNGVSINLFKGESFVVVLSDKTIPVIPGFVLADLECHVCTEIMSGPIRICSTGHSMCNICASKLSECSLCQSNITELRNYSLEQIAGRVTSSCPFKFQGCLFNFPQNKNDIHVKQCKFRPLNECILECYELCDFSGVHNDLETHWQEKHGQIHKNSDTYSEQLPTSSPNMSLISAFDETFMFIKECSPAYFMFSLTHITHEYYSSFHYDIQFSNPITGHFQRFCLPCDTSFNGVTHHQIPNDVLYNVICDNKNYNVKVNLFKK